MSATKELCKSVLDVACDAMLRAMRLASSKDPTDQNIQWGCYRLGWQEQPQDGATIGWLEYHRSLHFPGYEEDLEQAFRSLGAENLEVQDWKNYVVISWRIK